ncbi:asparaginase [Candidatus Woesearchaeota archaeon]|nr:asparaginase [Candidatus Woesearchaeota archaeon]
MVKSKIHFILTGGTIDSYYDGIKDTAVPNEHSIIPRYIKSLKLYEEFEFSEICMKDSRNITKSNMKKIYETVEKSPHKRIIITHGTYTMPDTARYIEANLKNKNKVIIFTGSMIPLVGFSPSDAPFHLGFSISKSHELSNGIYICMNGKVFSPKEIVKTIPEGRFSSIFNR